MASRKIVSFDWAIKNILRDKANYDVLEGFLLALLKEKITITDLIESESNQPRAELKFNRVDLLAVNSRDEHIIIEVQYSPERSFFKRLLYGTSKDIIDNLKLGEDYSKVKKVYSISLIYFDVELSERGKDPIDYVYHGKVDFTGFHNDKPVKIDSNFLIGYDQANKEDINIFPEYYIIPITIFNDVINDDLDQWIYAFKHSEVKAEFRAPGIEVMSEKLDILSMTNSEKRTYERYLETSASNRGTLSFAESKGRKEGKIEGKIEGIIEGEKVGMVKGKIEGKIEANITTAKNLKSYGVDSKIISEATGLSVAEIGDL